MCLIWGGGTQETPVSVTLPAGSTLKFNGGRIKNGNINANDTKFEAGHIKIFDNVTFSGKICDNRFKIEWFVDIYTQGVLADTSLCAASQFEEAMNSGVNYLTIGRDRFYPLQRTIDYIGIVNIFEECESNVDNIYESRSVNLRKPCIYSNNIVTLIDYKFNSPTTANGVTSQSLSLRGLSLLCNKDYTNADERDIPILKITSQTNMLNVTVDAIIKATDRNVLISSTEVQPGEDGIYISSANTTDFPDLHYFLKNYTGIIFASTSTGFMTNVTINGSITSVYRAVGCINSGTAGGWQTCMNLNCDTTCVIGAELDKHFTPLIVTNQHQCTPGLEKNNQKAYFESAMIALYGYVYDVYGYAVKDKNRTNKDTGIYSVRYASHLANRDGSNVITLEGLQQHSSKVDRLICATSVQDSLKNNHYIAELFNSTNALNTAINGNYEGNIYYLFSGVSYKLKSLESTDWNDSSVVNMLAFEDSNSILARKINTHKIFGDNFSIPSAVIGNTVRANYPYIRAKVDYKNTYLYFKISFTYNPIAIGIGEIENTLILNFQSANFSNITLNKIIDGSVVETINNFSFYPLKIYAYNLTSESQTIEITWKWKVPNSSSESSLGTILPLIYIPSYGLPSGLKYVTGSVLPSAPRHEPILWRHRDENRLFFSKGSDDVNVYTKFYDADGFLMNRKVGTTAQRPTSGNVSEGYQYYDSDLKKYILWNGTDWVNLDGTALS